MPKNLTKSACSFGVVNSTMDFTLDGCDFKPLAGSRSSRNLWYLYLPSEVHNLEFSLFSCNKNLFEESKCAFLMPDNIRPRIMLSFRWSKLHFPACEMMFVKKERNVSPSFWSLLLKT